MYISMITWLLMSIVVLIILFSKVKSILSRTRFLMEPSIVKASHWLWGSAIDFNTNAVQFLQDCREQYGRVFTIRLLNQYLTIVMDAHSVETLSRERAFNFQVIQEQVNRNVFGFTMPHAEAMIKNTAKTVKGDNLLKGASTFADNLKISFNKVCHNTEDWQTIGIRKLSAETIFESLFYAIFGRGEEQDKLEKKNTDWNPENIYNNFEIFHHYFNYLWLGVPIWLMPKAKKALSQMVSQPSADALLSRSDTCDYIKNAITFMQGKCQTETDIQGHNLVFLHVNYNTFRLSFWAINHVLADATGAKEALYEEIKDAVNSRIDDDTGIANLTIKDVEQLPILDSVVKETFRMASGVFMVRYVTRDTEFSDSVGKKYMIRSGDRIAVYPPALHKDKETFEDPMEYKYDRFVGKEFFKDGVRVKQPLLPFGTLCPGKRLATLHLKWYILSMFNEFELKLTGDSAPAVYDIRYHGHEVLPPVKDVNIDIKRRTNYVRANFV